MLKARQMMNRQSWLNCVVCFDEFQSRKSHRLNGIFLERKGNSSRWLRSWFNFTFMICLCQLIDENLWWRGSVVQNIFSLLIDDHTAISLNVFILNLDLLQDDVLVSLYRIREKHKLSVVALYSLTISLNLLN